MILDSKRAKDYLEVNVRLGAVIRVGGRGSGSSSHREHRIYRLGRGSGRGTRVSAKPRNDASDGRRGTRGRNVRLNLLRSDRRGRRELIKQPRRDGRRRGRREGAECPVVNRKFGLDGGRDPAGDPSLCVDSLEEHLGAQTTANFNLARVDAQLNLLVICQLAVAPDERRSPAAPQQADVLTGGLEYTGRAARRDKHRPEVCAFPGLQHVPRGLEMRGEVHHEANVERIHDAMLDMSCNQRAQEERNGVVESGSELHGRGHG